MPKPKLNKISEHLCTLQRNRKNFLRSRIMLENRTQAVVASLLGYNPSLTETKRKALWSQAGAVVAEIRAGMEHPCQDLVLTSDIGIQAFNNRIAAYESEMEETAQQLPVYEWVQQSDQKGFSALGLAKIVGECGNLADYSNPGKVWKRMGCVPITYEGETRMPRVWAVEKIRPCKLPSEVWMNFGYNRQRRSVIFVITESLLKTNGKCKDASGNVYVGPYRQRYLDSRERFNEIHPECLEDGKKQRSHRHGELMASKLLLKNLWIEWNDHPPLLPTAWKPEAKPKTTKRRRKKAAV